MPEAVRAKCAEAMSIEPADATRLFKAIANLISVVLFEGVTTKEALLRLLPGGARVSSSRRSPSL